MSSAEAGVWFVYAAASFVILLGLLVIFSDWREERRRHRRAH